MCKRDFTDYREKVLTPLETILLLNINHQQLYYFRTVKGLKSVMRTEYTVGYKLVDLFSFLCDEAYMRGYANDMKSHGCPVCSVIRKVLQKKPPKDTINL